MKFLAILAGFFFVIVGIAGLLAPSRLVPLYQYLPSTTGLYSVAVLRIGIGLVLWRAASRSRTPKTLRVLGIVILIAGIMTPLLGIERTRAILEWSLAQGSMPMRLWSGVALILGVFVMYSIVGRRRAA